MTKLRLNQEFGGGGATALGNGNKSFVRSIVSVIDPITGIRKEGDYGERQSGRWYEPPACPRMHGVGRHRRSIYGFGRRAAVVEPPRAGASGGCHRADEADDTGDRERYYVSLLADRVVRCAQGR